jgi:hypothetical protein
MWQGLVCSNVWFKNTETHHPIWVRPDAGVGGMGSIRTTARAERTCQQLQTRYPAISNLRRRSCSKLAAGNAGRHCQGAHQALAAGPSWHWCPGRFRTSAAIHLTSTMTWTIRRKNGHRGGSVAVALAELPPRWGRLPRLPRHLFDHRPLRSAGMSSVGPLQGRIKCSIMPPPFEQSGRS